MNLSARQRLAVYRASDYGLRFVGKPYYWTDDPERPMLGNDDPILGFDCSGLVSEILRSVGWIGGRERLSSNGILTRFLAHETNGPPAAGDVLVYGRKQGETRTAYHVSFLVDPYHQLEAGGGTRGTDTPNEQAKANAFVRIRPIEWRESERIALLRPVWSTT